MAQIAYAKEYADTHGLVFDIFPMNSMPNVEGEFLTNNRIDRFPIFPEITKKSYPITTIVNVCQLTNEECVEKLSPEQLDDFENATLDIWVGSCLPGKLTFEIGYSQDTTTYPKCFYIVWARSSSQIRLWYSYMSNKDDSKSKYTNIWKFGYDGWDLTKKDYVPVARDELKGYDTYVNDVLSDIRLLKENDTKFSQLKSDKGLCYVLCGPPGTGKTTFVKLIATILQKNIFCCDLKNGDYIETKLNPSPSEKKAPSPRILLIEDLKLIGGLMSALLNGLQGVEDNPPIIRFFTTNYPETLNNAPFRQRMHRILYFGVPDVATITTQIDRFFTTTGEITSELVAKKCHSLGFSMREINAVMSRCLMSSTPLDTMMEKMDHYVEEKKLLSEEKNEDNDSECLGKMIKISLGDASSDDASSDDEDTQDVRCGVLDGLEFANEEVQAASSSFAVMERSEFNVNLE